MATTTVQYTVSAAVPAQSKAGNGNLPSVLDISYTDANGNTQRIVGDAAPQNYWTITFTGTVGNLYHCSAKDVQNFGITTVTAFSGGSQVATENNSANTKIKAGVTGTL